jgi:hypothetical protein
VVICRAAPDEQALAVPELPRGLGVSLAVQGASSVRSRDRSTTRDDDAHTGGMPCGEITPTGEIKRVINTYYGALGLGRYVTGFADVEVPPRRLKLSSSTIGRRSCRWSSGS